MKLAAVAISLSLITASVAMADERHDHEDRPNWSAEHRFSHEGRDWRDDRRGNDEWRDDRRDDGYRERRDGRFQGWEHRQPSEYREHHWHSGERLPSAYYGPQYVIGDYRAYSLREPPRGCHWVRVNNDVVLAAVATGVVLDVVYNHFY